MQCLEVTEMIHWSSWLWEHWRNSFLLSFSKRSTRTDLALDSEQFNGMWTRTTMARCYESILSWPLLMFRKVLRWSAKSNSDRARKRRAISSIARRENDHRVWKDFNRHRFLDNWELHSRTDARPSPMMMMMSVVLGWKTPSDRLSPRGSTVTDWCWIQCASISAISREHRVASVVGPYRLTNFLASDCCWPLDARRRNFIFTFSPAKSIRLKDWKSNGDASCWTRRLNIAIEGLIASKWTSLVQWAFAFSEISFRTQTLRAFLSVGQDGGSAQSIEKGKEKKKKTTSVVAIGWERRNIGDDGHGKIFISCDDDLRDVTVRVFRRTAPVPVRKVPTGPDRPVYR